ncbi:hypothetical protein KIS4809_3030 [Bacillus sp. ZZV12-4809]|nr:hypothetical protein KIS4809_3030 [Bacillus sp. ZZV12-4809]
MSLYQIFEDLILKDAYFLFILEPNLQSNGYPFFHNPSIYFA